MGGKLQHTEKKTWIQIEINESLNTWELARVDQGELVVYTSILENPHRPSYSPGSQK